MLRNSLPKVTMPLPGPKAKAIIERRENAIPNAIKCGYPCVIDRGEGAMFQDVDGNIFMDWIGGVGVLNMGYSNPAAMEAVQEQSKKYFHGMMNIVTHEPYIELAEKINQIAPVKGTEKKTMFANSGAEADENAVKIARNYTKRPNILVFSGAFHGRTMMTMAMTANKAYAKDMGPFPDGIYRADFPYMYRTPGNMTEAEAIDFYVGKLKQAFVEASPANEVAAIMVEAIQGEGGFVPAPIAWVKAVRKICDEEGILLIVDEVQTGFARSGRMFATDYWKEAGCPPDILTSAKSIAAGVPLSMVVASKEIMDGVTVGTIGGTFCGNVLACASALKVIEQMEEMDLPGRALEISEKIMKVWNGWKDKYDIIGDVRGTGCMMGIEYVTDKTSKTPNKEAVNAIIAECTKNGLIMESAGTYGNVIRFLAPLVITDEQIDAGLEIYENAIKTVIG